MQSNIKRGQAPRKCNHCGEYIRFELTHNGKFCPVETCTERQLVAGTSSRKGRIIDSQGFIHDGYIAPPKTPDDQVIAGYKVHQCAR